MTATPSKYRPHPPARGTDPPGEPGSAARTAEHFHQHSALCRGRHRLRSRLRHHLTDEDQSAQRLPPPRFRHPGRHPRPRDPETAGRLVLPRVAALAAQARRTCPDQRGRDLLHPRVLDSSDGSPAAALRAIIAAGGTPKLVGTLGIENLSKSQVSQMAGEVDEQVEAFRIRPLDTGPYTFVAADALVLKVREAGRVVPVHALVAHQASTLMDTARSSASRSPPARTAPAGWDSSATSSPGG